MTQERQVRLPLGDAEPGKGVVSPSPRARQSERKGLKPVRLELGRTVATPGALRALEEAGAHPLAYLARHASGDWGELEPCDREANRRALRDGERVLSCYRTRLDERIWVQTEWDRSYTTIMLPSEY